MSEMLMSEVAGEGELTLVNIDEIEFPCPWSDEVSPLDCNRRMPIIVSETATGWRLWDGFGRVCGRRNAGHETVHAIIVTTGDLAERTGAGDDPEWVADMHDRYASETSKMAR